MKYILSLIILCSLLFSGCAKTSTPDLPAMIPRPIAPNDPPIDPYGTSTPLDFVEDKKVTLFVPNGYQIPEDGNINVTYHFHGATWFAIQEHLRRGLSDPVVALELGEGSTVYKTPFLDQSNFRNLLNLTEATLAKKYPSTLPKVTDINLTSYSAGYGAVREIIKVPEYVEMINRIVLGDSSYGSLDDELLAKGERVVVKEHLAPWVNFGRIAMTGEKTLLMLSSDIKPGSYAGTMEVCRGVAEELGIEIKTITPNSVPAAASHLEYPLHSRADSGGFHWWGYGGEDPVVHMTIARRFADAWVVLDEMKMP